MTKFNKTRINSAFRNLRTQGFLAKQNYKCCSSCAGSFLAHEATKLVGQNQAPKGIVFYHNQDADCLRAGRPFYLGFGNIETEKHGPIGLPTVEVGKIVVEAFTRAGVRTEWDGTADTRILVLP